MKTKQDANFVISICLINLLRRLSFKIIHSTGRRGQVLHERSLVFRVQIPRSPGLHLDFEKPHAAHNSGPHPGNPLPSVGLTHPIPPVAHRRLKLQRQETSADRQRALRGHSGGPE